jgi:short-subunit dehydrogenase
MPLANRRRLFALGLLTLLAVGLGGCVSTRLGSADQARLANKTYVITGASSGFGRGVAVRLGAEHANVVLAARRTELLGEVAAQVEAAGGKALVVTTDVSKPEEVERLASSAVDRFGRIDVWINNVGVGAIGRFWEIPVVDQARIIDVNLKGVVYGSHAALRQFRSQGFGSLVNIGSIDSEVPLAYQATYAATKAGVLSLSRSLNEELRLNGSPQIRVSTIMPWAADTPWWRHAANYSGGTPRMAAMDDPSKVVEAIIWVSLHPREELPVGWKARASDLSHHVAPDLTERLSANIAHKYQIKTAPPAPPTAGSIHAPMEAGRGVDDRVRARMKAEDAARKAPDH